MTPDEIREHMEDYRRQALKQFPFELIETTGAQALSGWRELKAAGRGSPVVLVGDREKGFLDDLLMPFGPETPNAPPRPSVEGILRAAADIRFPDDLARRKKHDGEAALERLRAMLAANPDMPLPRFIVMGSESARTYMRAETIDAMLREPRDPPVGEWPPSPNPSTALSVAREVLTGAPLAKVYIALAPTEDWTAIPAYLRWGGWNACPAAEYHVAAMRTWRDRFGAELVGMSSDRINLRVASKPQTREEAFALARSQYIYCPDIIDQGVGTYSALAADLMADEWWGFWWD